MLKRPLVSAVILIGVGIIFGIALVSSITTGGISSVFAANKEIGAKSAPVNLSSQVQAINEAFANASKAVNATVVNINVITETKVSNNRMQDLFRFFGSPNEIPNDEDKSEPETQRSEGAGSGVIVSEDGYIITNNHVVADAKEDGIKVILSDRKEYKAKLIGRDPLTDIAVIKIEAQNLPVAHISNSDEVLIGEMVIAVGNPLGLNRDKYAVENFIQTDAAINPGNSGGGLFNLKGSLIGINTAIASRTGYFSGYGFAIPANLVRAVAMDLIEDGKVDRGYIGISLRPIDELSSKSLKLDKVAGALVDDVLKDSPAEKAGIEAGDVILELDGKPINSSNDLQSYVAQKRAGDKVNLKLWRDGKSLTKSVTLKRRDKDDMASADDTDSDSNSSAEESTNKPVSFKELGFSIGPLTDKAKKEMEIETGVLITKVDTYSAAAERGIFPNGIIVKADKQQLNSTGQLKKMVESRKGDVIRLQIKYKEGTRLVFMEVPKDKS
jgi:serine protease Do